MIAAETLRVLIAGVLLWGALAFLLVILAAFPLFRAVIRDRRDRMHPGWVEKERLRAHKEKEKQEEAERGD